MNLKEKVICFKNKVQRKALPVVASATAAISAVVVTVSADEVGSSSSTISSMMTSLTDAIKTGFTEIIDNCVDVAVMILPIGLGLYGLGKIWDVAKKFFTKSTS